MRNRYQTIVKSVLLAFFGLFLYTGVAFANEHGAENKAEEGKLDIKGEIFSHIRDSYDWHFFNLGEGHDAVHVSIPLPVILINTDRGGVDVFLSSKFHHGHETYKDYQLNTQNGKIESTDNTSFYDISITKNVVSMLISLLILWFLMTGVAKKYKKNGINKAPTGFQNALEPIIGFIQDTVAKPYLGNKSMKYMPLLLSLFFFIWINNLLGLIPGGANLTGNIAVTLVLALVFFVVMLFNSNKYFWGHIFNPP